MYVAKLIFTIDHQFKYISSIQWQKQNTLRLNHMIMINEESMHLEPHPSK